MNIIGNRYEVEVCIDDKNDIFIKTIGTVIAELKDGYLLEYKLNGETFTDIWNFDLVLANPI